MQLLGSSTFLEKNGVSWELVRIDVLHHSRGSSTIVFTYVCLIPDDDSLVYVSMVFLSSPPTHPPGRLRTRTYSVHLVR